MSKWQIFFNLIQSESRKYLFASTFLGLMWFFIELSFVYIIQGFLFSLNLIDSDKLSLPDWYPLGIQYSVWFLITFGALRSLTNYAKSFFSIASMQTFNREIRERLVELGLDSDTFSSTSEYLTLFSEKVNQSGVFIQYLSLSAVTAISVLLFMGFGFYYAPYEMIFSLSILLIVIIPLKKRTYIIQKAGENLISNWTQINSEILLTKNSMFFLKIYDLVHARKKELKDRLESFEKSYFSYASNSSFLTSLPMFVGIVVLGLCSYMSMTYFKTEGVKVLSFFYIFLRLSLGLSELSSTYAVLKLSYPSIKDLNDSLVRLDKGESFKKTESIRYQQLSLSQAKVDLKIKNLNFSYDSKVQIFKDFNLNLSEDDILVIKGPSGSGKSTLLKLLLGLEKPTAGQVLLNELPIASLNPVWRHSLGYVGPEPYLIKGTIRENLSFGHFAPSTLTDDMCIQVLKQTGLYNEFKNMNLTLDSGLNESSFLSTGQRQRLSIARAFLRSPRIMIFDEATANLDVASEARVLSEIQALAHKMLVIIVTHKNSFDKLGTKFVSVGNLS